MRKNLILVSLDTVRADVAYSGDYPAIEALRRLGVTFSNTMSSSPLTPVSHATVFTGLQPYHHGLRHLFREKIADGAPLLAERLAEQGYDTGAVVSCPGLHPWYGFARGFSHYDHEIPRLADGRDPLLSIDVGERGRAAKRADAAVDRALAWLEGRQEPFFLFLHLFDAHWPYEAPEKFGGSNAYEEEVAYADHHLGRFLQALRERGLLDCSTILCFSDHGEDLCGVYPNDKGGLKLGHPEELGHGCLLYQQTLKTVLIVVDPDLPAAATVERQVRLVDVTPTLLDLLALPHDPARLDGRSLVGLVRGERFDLPAYSETHYPEEQAQLDDIGFVPVSNKKSLTIDNRWKVIFHLGTDRVEYFDLASDPNETVDLGDRRLP